MGISEITPRERVLLALSRRETDRVPVDFLATRETWAALRQEIGAADNETALRRLGIDVRHPRQPYIGPPLRRDSAGGWYDAWGVGRKPVSFAGGIYNEIFFHPLAGIRDPAELAKYPWPQPEWWDAEGLKRQIQALDAHESHAIALPEFGDPGGIFEIAWYLRGMEQFMADMALEPQMALEIMRYVSEFYMGLLDRVMSVVGERVDLIWTSDDIAHQRGPLISERTWRTVIAPFHEKFNRRVHELGARVMYHSCGAVRRFIPGLIGIGVDVLDVLQFSANGMDPCEIKSNFGDRLCFHGGMDVQSTLPLSVDGEVGRVAKERIRVLGRNGGYILSPGHNIQIDTPIRNILAMYAAAGSLNLEAGNV